MRLTEATGLTVVLLLQAVIGLLRRTMLVDGVATTMRLLLQIGATQATQVAMMATLLLADAEDTLVEGLEVAEAAVAVAVVGVVTNVVKVS
jgi:hypothetical protein